MLDMTELPELNSLSSEEKDALIIALFEQVQSLVCEVSALKSEIIELKAKKSKNSRNSSKPPSSDGYDKPQPKSQRQKSQRSSGGQPGHKGSTLERVSDPDEVVTHRLEKCPHCDAELSSSTFIGHESRQTFDLPQIKINVTEHRVEIHDCACCQRRGKAPFPADVTQPAQYGKGIKSLVTYLSHYQLLPFKRLQELFQDLLGISLSQGTLNNSLEKCSEQLIPFEQAVKAELTEGQVVHFDESGIRVKKELNWLHVASTPELTYYRIHLKRGQEAMDEMGILPDFQGIAVHDHWKSYYGYECYHALCNAHHLRELTFACDQYQQHWSSKLIDCLVEAKQEVDEAKASQRSALDQTRINYYERRYSRILREGIHELPTLDASPQNKRGKPAQHKIKNLHDRLVDHKWEVLAYIYNFSIPFDNNLAERDVRMVKTKQKISGCFRSRAGADRFALIRSYLSTVRKNGINVLEALASAFAGIPFIPDSSKSG